jgi:mono/diheme cytochrome c family protein
MSVSRRRRNAIVLGWAALPIFVIALLLNAAVSRGNTAAAQQSDAWTAPATAKSLKNPVRTTPQGVQEAGELFQQICATCHGARGAGDGVLGKSLTPKPANLTDARRMNRATDGELYWKITNGRGPMPSWQQLPEKQRWELVNYLRTLAPRGSPPAKRDSLTK